MKRFDAFNDGKSIHFREGTSDETIIRSVLVDRNEYLLPNIKPKIVFDIGANIGVTAILIAKTYPDATVYAFEPVTENFELLVKNTTPYPNVVCVKSALGAENAERAIHPSTDAKNFGGFSLFENGSNMSASFTIQVVNINDAVEKYGIPEIIKIDAEGSEFEILTGLKAASLKRVVWIAGELHGVNDYQLLAHLDLDFRTMVNKPLYGRTYQFHALLRNSDLDQQGQQQ